MKKTLVLCLTLLVFCILLTACGGECTHAYDNDCDASCNECGEERSVAHKWLDADCEKPKTCSVCGESYGEPLAHTWKDADCLDPKTCTVCGETEGEKLGHVWTKATCEAPKTCTRCGDTDGSPKEHTYEDEYTILADGHYYKCICHPSVMNIMPHADYDGDLLCDDCGYEFYTTYTVTLDRNHADVEVVLENGQSTFTELTDEDGIANFIIPKAKYTLTVTHYNSAYIWTDEENTVTLTEDNNSYTASFNVITDYVEHVINLFNPDNSICIGAEVFLYKDGHQHEGTFITNVQGQAILNVTNDDYVFSIHAPDGNYVTGSFRKDGPTTLSITVKENSPGLTAENPFVIYDLEDLPYSDDYVASLPFDNSHDFEAGESIYLLIPKARGKVINLGTDKLTVELDGVPITPDANNSFTLDANGGDSVVMKLTASEACTEQISVTHPGCKSEPIEISSSDINGYAFTYNFEAGESVYFSTYGYANRQLEIFAEGAEITVNNEKTDVVFTENIFYKICVTAKEAGEIEISFSCMPIDSN